MRKDTINDAAEEDVLLYCTDETPQKALAQAIMQPQQTFLGMKCFAAVQDALQEAQGSRHNDQEHAYLCWSDSVLGGVGDG